MIERTGCAPGAPINVVVTNEVEVKNDVGNPLAISATSLPLPTGAATEATLLTLLTTAAFQARINTLGQKLMAASTPVVIASDQSVIPISNANLDVALSTRASEATLLLIKAKTDNLDVLLSTRASEATLATMLTLAGFQARINTLGQKTMANSTPVVLASDQSAIPVTATISGSPNVTVINAAGASAVNIQDGGNSITIDAVSLPLPTGAATEATLLLIKAKTDNLDVALSTRATEATLLLIKAKTDNLDVALSTRATEATLANVLTTAAFQARINTLGQKTMANSTPVVLASDQSVIPVSQSGTWNINNISGTITLPTGAATEATLATMLTLAGFQARINTLGQKTMANSTPVVISSDQSALTVNASPTTVGTWANGVETVVAAVAISVLAANANRKRAIIQNTGIGNVRVGVTGVTNTTGTRLTPGGSLVLEMPYCETNAIFAIREGAVSSTILAQETT